MDRPGVLLAWIKMATIQRNKAYGDIVIRNVPSTQVRTCFIICRITTLEFSKPFKNNIGSCKTTGEGIYAGTKCALPFIYKGIQYTGCTSVDSDDGKTWCSIKVDKEGKHVNQKGLWGHCNSMCPNDLGKNTLVHT